MTERATPTVLVVGDVIDDILVRPLSEVSAASDTNAEIRRTGGGSAANVAAWLGHLGVPTRFVGKAGAGGAAAHTTALAAHGVDARIATHPTAETASLLALLDPTGERTMYVDRGANATLRAADLPDDLWHDVDWLHLTGYSLFDAGVRAVALDLLTGARERGIGVSVDPSSEGFLRACGVEEFLAWVEGADLLLPNLPEAHLLSGADAPAEMAGALTRRGVAATVVTCGADGATYAAASGVTASVAAEPAEVTDTTGAGDAFAAGFLSVWITDRDPHTALAAGAAAAAVQITSLGARPPRRAPR